VPDGSNWKAMLFYRAAGSDEYASTKMTPRFTEIVGRIPAEATGAASVQYYIEVRDEAGNMVATSGKARSPNIVYIEPNAKPHYYRDLSERGSGFMVGSDVESEQEAADAAARAAAAAAVEPTRPLTYAKWATTGGSVALFGAAVALYLAAKNSSDTLNAEADDSRSPPSGQCISGDPPCTQFSDYQKALQDTGKSYELWTHITLGLGAASAIAAGTLWYLDLRHPPKSSNKAAATAAPVISGDFVGGAAVIHF
jgi:hypothetical protein